MICMEEDGACMHAVDPSVNSSPVFGFLAYMVTISNYASHISKIYNSPTPTCRCMLKTRQKHIQELLFNSSQLFIITSI